MALFAFGKKRPEELPALGRGRIPADRVNELSSKGFSEPEMIDILRKEGFSADEIDKALTSALKVGVSGAGQSGMSTEAAEQRLPELPADEMPQEPSMPVIPETSLPQEYYYPQAQHSAEEYVNYLVKEKMQNVDQRINEFMIKNKELDKKMDELHEQLLNIAQSRTGEQQQILLKLESFKDMIEEMSLMMGSLEKAFKDTLPALIESIRALSDLAQRFKREA